MLGDRVIYKLKPDMDRVGIVTREYDDGTVDVAVLRNATDLTHPLDYAVKGFAKVKYGEGAGECIRIGDPALKELVAEAMKEIQRERMAIARAARGKDDES